MTQTGKSVLPYGQWSSSVTAEFVSQRIRLEDVVWAADGKTLVWSEGRPTGNVLVRWGPELPRQDLTTSPRPSGGVGYGGGHFTIAPGQDQIIFAASDGKLYRRGLFPEAARAITPTLEGGGAAAPAVSSDGKWVLFVYSDGKTDLLALVDSSGSQWPVQFTRGADFYMQPAWHPQGTYAAWVEWDHPNMPWDGTRLKLAHLEGSPPRPVDVQELGGGADSPAEQPVFSPDGRWLCFIEESGEWPDLILYDLQNGQRRVLLHGDGFDISWPAWSQGAHSTAWSADSRRLYYLKAIGANNSICWIEPESGESGQIPTEPYTWITDLAAAPTGDALAFVASAPDIPDRIVIWDGNRLQVAAESVPATYDPASLPTAQEFTWQTSSGEPVYGLVSLPRNPRYQGSGLPPAILSIHGGPTSLAANSFNAIAAFFTSRGYAFVQVNYRGSTGYGRSYRQAMRQRWGDVDVEDAVTCAQALGELGLADSKRLAIMGGSAGGYTVLNALIRYPGVFKAGVCLYGVTDLFALDLDTHKFEAHYNATLVGELPEAAERYRAWSPIFHAERIADPLYIFQGGADKVVTPNQAQVLVDMLQARGIPFQFKLYESEGHGFRKAETITDYLNETERFLRKHVIFA